MPPRLVSLGILLLWAVSASGLLVRDVLPELLVGPPPDLRDIALADEQDVFTRWTLLVVDPSGDDPGDLRAVGHADTEMHRQPDGHVRFRSTVKFDAGALLQQTPLESSGGERMEVTSLLDVDGSGNLGALRSSVRVEGDPNELLVLEGHLEDDAIKVVARGPMLIFGKRTFTFPYKARGMVQNSMAPLERIPGLHVGQCWESRVVSPLTGRVETVHVEVTDRNVMIPWGDGLVPTYEIVTRMNTGMGAVSPRTWARASDGLVLRQEVPLMIFTLILERQPPPDDLDAPLRADPGSRR